MSREIEYLYDLTGESNCTRDSDGLHITGNVWINHRTDPYVPVDPAKSYYYDMVYSVDTGNQFYIGYERYDEDKASTSNNSCVYQVATKPTTDVRYVHTFGKFNGVQGTLSTGKPVAYIKLRILNKWSGSATDTTGKATIHSLSLKEVNAGDSFGKQSVTKTGIMTSDSFREGELGTSIRQNGFIDSARFIEF